MHFLYIIKNIFKKNIYLILNLKKYKNNLKKKYQGKKKYIKYIKF